MIELLFAYFPFFQNSKSLYKKKFCQKKIKMKKILFEQIDQNHLESAEIFRCSLDKNHLVEEPLICQESRCQQLICKSCYITYGRCPICNNPINESEFPMILRNLLNPIFLKCENYKNGCMVEIEYEHYRGHTKNCRFKIAEPLEAKDYNSKVSDVDNQNISKVNEAQLPQGNNNIPESTNYKYYFDKSLCFLGKVLKYFSDDKHENKLSKNFPSESKPKEKKIIMEENKGESKAPMKAQTCNKMITNEELSKFKDSDFENLTINEMKKLLGKRNISKSGNKSELIIKLKFYIENLKNKGKNKLPSKDQNKPIKYESVLSDYESSSSDDSDSDSDISDDESDISEEEFMKRLGYNPFANPMNFSNNYVLNIPDAKLKMMTRNELDMFTVEDLKDLLEKRGIPRTGNKADLITKLKTYFSLIEKYNTKIEKKKNKPEKNQASKKIKKKKKLMEKTLDELKDILYRKKLPISGNKSDLIERLISAKK